jgi:hypothetical protein
MVPNPPEPPVPLEPLPLLLALLVAASPPEPDAVAVDAAPPVAAVLAPPDPLVPPAPVVAPELLDPLLVTGSAVPHALTKRAAKAPRTREVEDDFTATGYLGRRRGRNPAQREISSFSRGHAAPRGSAEACRGEGFIHPHLNSLATSRLFA